MSTATDRPLWEPSPALMRGCRLASYLAWLGQRQGRSFQGYHELQLWSAEDLEGFWASIWDYFGVLHHAPYERVLGRRTMPGAEWFPGACLNYAENLLHGSPGETVAIVHSSESRDPGEMTWTELRAAVAQVAGALRALGIRRGDRVASVLPNVPEAVVAFLASASIGAVWSSCSPDLGVEAVVDRFAQVAPKVLLCADGYRYGGRVFDRRDYNAQLRARLPDVRSMIVLEYLGTECWYLDGDATVAWDQLPRLGPPLLEFEPVPFDHPLWILYSSGTTGAPKALVQGHGGILLEHLKTHHLHLDLGPADRFFWFSTTGWMMWNFLVSGLLAGAAIVLYDGHPGYPDLTRLWELAEQARITVFGTSAAFIDACMTAGVRPTDGRDLGSVRSVGSTGSSLSAAAFDWVYRELGSDTWLFSMSGGTDVCSAFIGGVPLLPVYRGELQAAALGVALDSYDDHGRPQRGRPGELVVTQPMPSMPVFFWGDEDHKRYREAYFGVYPGAWRHGDWLELTQRGTGIIHGRSDSTINRSGIRIGTSEIYRAVLRLPEVVDALVVDITKHGRDGFVVLFVVLRDNGQLDTTTEWRIAERLRRDCSPRHVPDDIVAVAELPRTATGKLLEVPVKRILNGVPLEKAVARESLANPHALEPFLKLAFASLGLAREAEPCYVSCTDRSVQRLPVRGKEKTMTMITTREAQMEANKAVMRRYIEELWNQRNWDVIDEIIHPDYRSEPPSFPGEWGVADLKENCPPFMAMYPDGKWKTLDMVAEGDRVACAWEFNATHTVDGFGIKATGEKVRVLVIGIYTVRDGKIVSLRKLNVGVDFFTAFGLPQPDPAAA